MTSNDNQQYITMKLLNSKMETSITQVQVNTAKIEMLQNTFYWRFAILSFIPLFRHDHKKNKAKLITQENVLEIVKEAIAKLLAISGLSVSNDSNQKA